MKYHDPHRRNGTIVTQAVCAILFCAFSFLWLYWFQADVLSVAQFTLSHGVTHYNPLVGALLITAVLQLLQVAVAVITRLRRHTHALTYVPSALLLAIISDYGITNSSRWLWIVPLVLVMWIGAVWLARQMLPFASQKEPSGLFSRRVWVNVLLLVLQMLAIAALSNTNAVYHYRAHAEQAILRNDADEALRVGYESLETDACLTMVRAYALAKTGQLGDRLFTYAVAGTGADLIPMPGNSSRTLLLPADSIYALCGAKPVKISQTERYLDLVLKNDTLATPAALHYRLCGLLIDKQLDAFVRTLQRHLAIGDSLPRHYREALTLYAHQRSHPLVVYHNEVMDQDWDDLQKLERDYAEPNDCKVHVAERYHGSYWYYYFYHPIDKN